MIKNELYYNAETVIQRTKKATPMGWLTSLAYEMAVGYGQLTAYHYPRN